MAFLFSDTGQLRFRDGLELTPMMTEKQLEDLSIFPDEGVDVVPLKAHPVSGGSLAPILLMENGLLAGVELHVAAIGQRQDADTDRQRGFLFEKLGFRDPCPDTRGNVRIACPFGEVFFCTDPYTGFSCARMIYRAQITED